MCEVNYMTMFRIAPQDKVFSSVCIKNWIKQQSSIVFRTEMYTPSFLATLISPSHFLSSPVVFPFRAKKDDERSRILDNRANHDDFRGAPAHFYLLFIHLNVLISCAFSASCHQAVDWWRSSPRTHTNQQLLIELTRIYLSFNLQTLSMSESLTEQVRFLVPYLRSFDPSYRVTCPFM